MPFTYHAFYLTAFYLYALYLYANYLTTLQIKAVEKQRKSSGFAAFIGPLQSRLFFSIRPMQTIYECNNYIR